MGKGLDRQVEPGQCSATLSRAEMLGLHPTGGGKPQRGKGKHSHLESHPKDGEKLRQLREVFA